MFSCFSQLICAVMLLSCPILISSIVNVCEVILDANALPLPLAATSAAFPMPLLIFSLSSLAVLGGKL